MILKTENGNVSYESLKVQAIFAFYGNPETILKKGGITILVMIWGVRRNFFKEVYQNDYHEGFCNQPQKWCYGNKKKLVLPWHHSARKPLVGFLPRLNFLLQKVIYGVIFLNFLKNAIFLSDQFIRRGEKTLKKSSSIFGDFTETY